MRSPAELELVQPQALPSARVLAGKALGEVWRFLPAWMFFIYGCLLLNTELTNLDPPRPDLAYTALFPLSVFALFYAARARWAPDVVHRGPMFYGVAALCVVLPLLNFYVHRPSPLPIAALRQIYELSNFIWAGLMLAHALRHRPSHAALFFGVGLFYGALLENGGIYLDFYREHHLTATQVGPLPAPLATMLGWCVVLYMATFTVWELRRYLPWLKRSSVLGALAIAGFATLLDLQIDPAATATGCWVWNPTLPAFFHGVPLVNFVAWVCALFPFAYVMLRSQELYGVDEARGFSPRQLGWAFATVPVVLFLAALMFIGSTGVLEGTAGPSWELLHRALATILSRAGA